MKWLNDIKNIFIMHCACLFMTPEIALLKLRMSWHQASETRYISYLKMDALIHPVIKKRGRKLFAEELKAS